MGFFPLVSFVSDKVGVGGRAPKNGDTLKIWWPKVILMSNHVNKHNLVKKVEKSPI